MNVRVSLQLIRRSLHQRSGPGDCQRVRWKLIRPSDPYRILALPNVLLPVLTALKRATGRNTSSFSWRRPSCAGGGPQVCLQRFPKKTPGIC